MFPFKIHLTLSEPLKSQSVHGTSILHSCNSVSSSTCACKTSLHVQGRGWAPRKLVSMTSSPKVSSRRPQLKIMKAKRNINTHDPVYSCHFLSNMWYNILASLESKPEYLTTFQGSLHEDKVGQPACNEGGGKDPHHLEFIELNLCMQKLLT